MTSPSFSRGAGPGRLSYARARLSLGVSGVGTAVLAAVCLLAFDIPTAGFSVSAEYSLGRSLFALGIFFAMVAALFFLFDLMGGAWVVRRKGHAQYWLFRWLRGAALQWLVWMLAAVALMVTARTVGGLATVAVFVAVQLLLAAFRGRMARLVAPLTPHPPSATFVQAAELAGLRVEQLRVVDSPDEGFVGGWSSLWPRTLLVPMRWGTLPVRVLAAQLARRKAVADSGAHLRGVLGALLWNTIGFVVVQQVTGTTPATAAGVVTLMAGMTLWAFAGVLLLPTPSRAAVYATDDAVRRTQGDAALRTSIELLDKWQDDEPTRTPNVERIFHPVPARSNRLARLDQDVAGGLRLWHAHNLARQALWMSWGALTPISRVVHCNVGRTALWVMLPGD
ncbi:hypothetical protein [Gemmatimonas sp.]|uniref:hypothetical protein n=1 Tax=Gemmatimonas sp. TaxID=1962908 RepID=UPI00391D3092